MAQETTALIHWIISYFYFFSCFLALAAKVRELELQKTELDKLKEQHEG